MKKKFYVYAGYYENYISSERMPKPFILQGVRYTIEEAISYADSFGDGIEYCENVKDDLPDYLYEFLQEHGYSFYKF